MASPDLDGVEPALAAHSPSTSSKARRWLVVWAGLVLVLLVGVGVLAKSRSRGLAELHGVRLGMTLRDVRTRFDTAGSGLWESEVAEDMVLRWKPGADARTGPLSAQFEFHMGILMAIRASLPPGDPAAKGPTFEVSDSTVVVREKTSAGPVNLTVIARSCPIHAKEADQLVQRRGGS